jgi:uncharacterized peroxidase-related enzyme
MTGGSAAPLARRLEPPEQHHSMPARRIPMYVTPVEPENATGALHALYEGEVAAKGYIPNYTRLFSLRPEAYRAWRQLVTALNGTMELRRYELATLAAAEALHCRYCVAAHGALLESKFYDRSQLEAIVRDFRNAGLDPVDVAIMAFAQKIARHAYEVTEADVAELRTLGLGDAEILDVALTASARSFFSKTLDAMGCEPDEALAGTANLLDLVGSSDTQARRG